MYLFIKAIHIISLVSWFAGLFYIWRLFVYHAESNEKAVHNQLAIMEKKLFYIIMQPAFILTIITGSFLLYLSWSIFSRQYWIWLKVFLVLLVIVNHFLSNFYRKKLLENSKYVSGRFFRLMNEVPTLLLMVIVFLVVLKKC